MSAISFQLVSSHVSTVITVCERFICTYVKVSGAFVSTMVKDIYPLVGSTTVCAKPFTTAKSKKYILHAIKWRTKVYPINIRTIHVSDYRWGILT